MCKLNIFFKLKIHCRHNFVNVFDFCVYFSFLFSYNLYTGADLKSTLMHKG